MIEKPISKIRSKESYDFFEVTEYIKNKFNISHDAWWSKWCDYGINGNDSYAYVCIDDELITDDKEVLKFLNKLKEEFEENDDDGYYFWVSW